MRIRVAKTEPCPAASWQHAVTICRETMRPVDHSSGSQANSFDRRTGGVLGPGRTAAYLISLVMLSLAGCASHITRITSTSDAVPAYRLPNQVLAPSRAGKVPINFTLLRQQPPASYVVSPGDTLGVYIQGVVPSSTDEQAPLYTNITGTRDAYPATGLIHAPVVGLPLKVNEQGALELPLVDKVNLSGMTLSQATEAVRKSYLVDHKILQPGRDRIIVTMIKPRVHRVLVVREDVSALNGPSYYNPVAVPYTKRGTAEILDLPVFENDVLHAIMATGGLPGIDAHNAVWVLRSQTASADDIQPMMKGVNGGEDPRNVLEGARKPTLACEFP